MTQPQRVVTDTMAGLKLPDFDTWSDRVATVLGQNPGPFTGPGTNTYLVGTSKQPLLLDTGIGLEVYDPYWNRACPKPRAPMNSRRLSSPMSIRTISAGCPMCRNVLANSASQTSLAGKGRGLHLPTDLYRRRRYHRDRRATLHAIHTPGHAKDHLCYYLEEEKRSLPEIWCWEPERRSYRKKAAA